MDAKRMAGIGALLIMKPKRKPEEEGSEDMGDMEDGPEAQEDTLEQVRLDTMQSFIDDVKAGNAESALGRFTELVELCQHSSDEDY